MRKVVEFLGFQPSVAKNLFLSGRQHSKKEVIKKVDPSGHRFHSNELLNF